MSVVILCGSETGNSLDYAGRASEELERIGIEAEVEIADEFDLSRLLEVKYLIFIGSTCGDGDCPKNMRGFMKFLLRADLPANLLEGIDYAVFGLGDSSYEKFNFVGKRVYRRLTQLGACDMLGTRGEGDEANLNGIEAGWSSWFPLLKRKLSDSITNSSSDKIYSDLEALPPRHFLRFAPNQEDGIRFTRRSMTCKLIAQSRVTPEDHFQDVRLITLKPSAGEYQFLPGDVLSMKPNNEPEQVEFLLRLLGLNGDADDVLVYEVESSGKRGNWNSSELKDIKLPQSLRQFFTEWVDFTRVPSKPALKTLATLCDLSAAEYSPMHQEKLLELSKDEGEYLDYIWRPKRTILEVIRDFQPTLSKIDPLRLLQIFSPIRARQFSVANDPRINDGRYELLVALVEEALPLGRGMRSGLCSRWINSERINEELKYCSISRGSINFNTVSESKVIFLFAAGTGIAPIRSIIQALAAAASNHSKRLFLYFGCRELAKDFYFETEWKEYKNLTVFAAGSRDLVGRKVYLNDLIKMNSEPISALNSFENVSFTITGHSRLPKIVFEAVKEIWKAASKDLKDLEAFKISGRFQTETWS